MATQYDHRSTSTAPVYAATDPHQLAMKFLKREGRDSHGHCALRYWRNEFWRYHEGKYRRLSDDELRSLLTAFISQHFRATAPTNKNGIRIQVTRSVVSNVMQALTGEVLVDANLEQPLWLGKGAPGPNFAFVNGLVGVEALLRRQVNSATPHCAEWFSETAFPYDFEAAAGCSRWLTFLDEVLEGDAERISLLQQWFGYCLTPDTTHQKFVLAVGEGANGKSVVLDTLTNMLGPDNVSHVRVELFAQRFQLTMTLGKLANISYDTGEIDESAEATIKEFTGGDRMYFDRKGVRGVMAYPSARLILATNHDPRFADRTKGIWRRMLVIPFRITIPDDRQDPQLSMKLESELPGIFNWAVEGLRNLRQQGTFVTPIICKAAWEEFRAESNPAQEFLRETYQPGDLNDGVPCAVVYQDYREWCAERGFKPLDNTRFGKELSKAFTMTKRVRETTGERRWRYAGVRVVDTRDVILDAVPSADTQRETSIDGKR